MSHIGSKLSFLLVTLVTMLLLGFSVAAQDQPVTVKLWMHEHPPRVPLDEELLEQFAAENPNIKVEYTVVPAPEWGTTLATAMASGTGPDLFNVDSFSVGDYFVHGNIVPVDAAAAGFADHQAIYD